MWSKHTTMEHSGKEQIGTRTEGDGTPRWGQVNKSPLPETNAFHLIIGSDSEEREIEIRKT
jgi:hypothetical protein